MANIPNYDDLLGGKEKIGIVGLGYVGLPLFVAFDRFYNLIGFDNSSEKVLKLREGVDETGEVTDEEMRSCRGRFTDDASELGECSVIIVAVPTPIDEFKTPDLGCMVAATHSIAKCLKPGVVIVYESTVYPGVTEEICKPVLESYGFEHGKDFFLGYSPERINPGDKERRIESILKIVSGDSPEVLSLVSKVYGKVITAGIHEASSIKVAEAAKVIENIQRDVNIALVNELSIVFEKIGIDTTEVLEAAGTKWNFIKMQPGLVGGHCIGVDPYYLTHKAEQIGYHPQIITSGRRINDSMSKYVAEQTVKKMIQAGARVKGAKILVLGLTFKENVPDIRNSKVKDVILELKSYNCDVYAHDPFVSGDDIQSIFSATPYDGQQDFDALVYAVPHSDYEDLSSKAYTKFGLRTNGVFVDIKSKLKIGELNSATLHWRL